MIELGASDVIGMRARANRLDRRRPIAELTIPTGLQDSAPRAAQLSLAARVTGLDSDGWRHPSFVQAWGPRGAAYLLRRYDLAPLTLGRLPRDQGAIDRLRREADAAIAALRAGEPTDQLQLRGLSATGRLLIEWDTRTSTVFAVDPPEIDVEQSRLELARRFLRVFAPATVGQFAKWAGVSAADARETWRRLPELVTVRTPSGAAEVLSLAGGAPERFVRLLPAEDPFLRFDRELLAGVRAAEVFPRFPTTAIRGAVVDTTRIVGWWQRQAARVAITMFATAQKPALDDAIELAEVEAWALPVPGAVNAVQISRE